MKYHSDWLINKFNQEETIPILFFWGHTPAKDGYISASCFSQWWDLSPFQVEGISYQTAEHWMMYQKAKLFEDEAIAKKVLESKTAAEAKKLGREVQNFDPITWDKHKYSLVKQGNLHKFGQHESLKICLHNTAPRILVEASPYDTIWGIGLAANAPEAANPTLWKGQNLLGFALMEVRDEL
jgi:ribA/ribD-fused uncharacterized protein